MVLIHIWTLTRSKPMVPAARQLEGRHYWFFWSMDPSDILNPTSLEHAQSRCSNEVQVKPKPNFVRTCNILNLARTENIRILYVLLEAGLLAFLALNIALERSIIILNLNTVFLFDNIGHLWLYSDGFISNGNSLMEDWSEDKRHV